MTDQERSFFYRLFARLLIAPIDRDLLNLLQQIQPDDDSLFCRALEDLQSAAQTANLKHLDDEFHTLFIGLGKGELSPYLSWYQTGFLMEKPLALLRQDLLELGFKRQSETPEPEDHISALCEVMALLISENNPGQARFFSHYLQPWYERFFSDLHHSGTGIFYPAVAKSGIAFMNLESAHLQEPT